MLKLSFNAKNVDIFVYLESIPQMTSGCRKHASAPIVYSSADENSPREMHYLIPFE